MKKIILLVVTILAWIATVLMFVQKFQQHNLSSVISHNQPHGLIGWTLLVTLILTVIAIDIFHQHPHHH